MIMMCFLAEFRSPSSFITVGGEYQHPNLGNSPIRKETFLGGRFFLLFPRLHIKTIMPATTPHHCHFKKSATTHDFII